jgi:hypothetical protein
MLEAAKDWCWDEPARMLNDLAENLDFRLAWTIAIGLSSAFNEAVRSAVRAQDPGGKG